MNGETAWLLAAIATLSTVLSGLATAVIKYLLKRIDTLEAALRDGNQATAGVNEANALMARMWIAEQAKRAESGKGSG